MSEIPTDYLDRLASVADGVGFDALTESAVRATKRVVLDTLGAIIAGSRLAENRRLAELIAERSGRRSATLIGHSVRAEPMLAALVNGTCGVGLEMDEGNRWGGGHPAIHVLPAVLAVAEEEGAGGRRVIESLVTGYEVTSRLGGATRTRENVHSHGTWGTAGAAVGVAKLLGHHAADLRTVINLAVSMSPANSWTPCFEGATIRNLYPGRANLQGVLAVHLLRCGYTALRDAPSDVYRTILGDGFDPGAAVDGLPLAGGEGPAARAGDARGPQRAAADGASYRIERNYFKLHACCLYNHPALDAMQALVREEGITAADVAHVTVRTIPFAARMVDAAPATSLSARFSIPYAVAAAIVLGTTDTTAFEPEALADERVLELAGRIKVEVDEAMSMRQSTGATASVSVALASGRTVERSTVAVRGDAENPVPDEVLREKFRFLAGDARPPAAVAAIIDGVARLEHMEDIRELTALLT